MTFFCGKVGFSTNFTAFKQSHLFRRWVYGCQLEQRTVQGKENLFQFCGGTEEQHFRRAQGTAFQESARAGPDVAYIGSLNQS